MVADLIVHGPFVTYECTSADRFKVVVVSGGAVVRNRSDPAAKVQSHGPDGAAEMADGEASKNFLKRSEIGPRTEEVVTVKEELVHLRIVGSRSSGQVDL